MESIKVEQQYRAPSDIVEKQHELLGIKEPPVALAVSPLPLVGTWMNCDHATPNLLRLMIAANGNEINLHAFGACTPNPCDWGQVNGVVYSDNVAKAPAVAFTGTYTFSFKTTTVVGRLFQGALIVETFDRFTDNSGRADYHTLNVLTK